MSLGLPAKLLRCNPAASLRAAKGHLQAVPRLGRSTCLNYLRKLTELLQRRRLQPCGRCRRLSQRLASSSRPAHAPVVFLQQLIQARLNRSASADPPVASPAL